MIRPLIAGSWRRSATSCPEPAPFTIGTQNVDAEIATLAGPQLVVPALNARFLLNAANARWGSLYDALYGTDALDAPPAKGPGYDADRGAAVIAAGRKFLDEALPLFRGSWADIEGADPVIPLANVIAGSGRVRTRARFPQQSAADRDRVRSQSSDRQDRQVPALPTSGSRPR